MDPDVRSSRVESEFFQQFGRILGGFFARKHRIAPRYQVPVNSRQAGRHGFFAQFVHSCAGRFDGTEVLDEFLHVVDRKVGLAVHRPIIRFRKIFFDNQVADLVERFGRHPSRIEDFLFVAFRVGVDVEPVVIGPHQREFQFFGIRRFQEAFVQRAVQERPVVVVIPVENENVDPVVGCRVDLTGHLRRVFFVGISPGRHFGLLLAVETGTGFLDQFPFGPAVALEAVVTSVVGVVIREIVAGYRDPVGVFRLFRRGAAGCECNSQRGAGDRGKDFHFESVLDRVIFVD